MSNRKILIYPDERLKIEATYVENIDQEILDIIEDLNGIMSNTSHSVGVAATQLGYSKRIVAVDASKNIKCTENHGAMILINPEIVSHDGLITFREGCMSVPDFTGNVNRAQTIKLSYYDEKFIKNEITLDGFESVVVQHELDHLDGILFIDRVISKRTDLFKRKNYK